MHKILVTLAVTGLAVGLAVTPAATATPPPATALSGLPLSTITWGSCTSTALQRANAQCGFLEVPLAYAHPTQGTVSIAVSRVKHTVPDSQYQGIMLVNPGGPGEPGLSLSALGKKVPNNAGAGYDWIGFDPRGVGASKPALHCVPDYLGYDRPNYVPTTPSLEQSWLARSKDYADACARDNAALLTHLKTTDSALDMDSIRIALGQRQINYYGFSYGTYLGEVYSTMFPDRVRRMVLDSDVDPRGVWYQDNLNQDAAFDRNIRLWFAWVARYDNVFHLGNTEQAVQRLYYAELADLARKPAGGLIGPDEWTDIFLNAAYYRSGWVDIGWAFANWVHHGDWQGLRKLYAAPGNDNAFAAYLGVQCTDVRWPANWKTWRTDNWRLYSVAPFLTWDNAWYNAPCLFWHAPAGTPVHIDGSRVSSALLIDETLDAATPYPGSLEVRQLYPHASLIAEPGGATHADSLSGDACVDDQIAGYLVTGKLPLRRPGYGPDTTCRPLPDPVPTAPSNATSTPAAAQIHIDPSAARSVSLTG